MEHASLKRLLPVALALVLSLSIGAALWGCSSAGSGDGSSQGSGSPETNSQQPNGPQIPADSTDTDDLGLTNSVVFSGIEARLDTFGAKRADIMGTPTNLKTITITYTNHTDATVSISKDDWSIRTAEGATLEPLAQASGMQGFFSASERLAPGKSVTGMVGFAAEADGTIWGTKTATVLYAPPTSDGKTANWRIETLTTPSTGAAE